MSFFFNDELNVNGKIITKNEIKTETSNAVKTSSFTASGNNFYRVNTAALIISLPEITEDNEGEEVSFALLKTSSRDIRIKSFDEEDQKILDTMGSQSNYLSNSGSNIEIKKYKSVIMPTDGAYFRVTSSGSGYKVKDFLTASVTSSPGFSNAFLSLQMRKGIIQSINISSGGSGYSSEFDTISISSNGGTSFSGSISAVDGNGAITAFSISVGGSGYTEFDYLNISGGSGLNFEGLLEVNSSGEVTGIEILNGGQDYSTSDSITINSYGGASFSGSLVIGENGSIVDVLIENGGYGFSTNSSNNNISISSSGGFGASLTTGTVSTDLEAVITSQSSGAEYVSAPSVTVTNNTRSVSSDITISSTLDRSLWIPM